MLRKLMWGLVLVTYAVFFIWYTNLSGPMNEQEIQTVLERMRTGQPSADVLQTMEAFMRSDTGDDFVMVNLLELNDHPPNLPATGIGATSMQLIGYYMEHMYAAQFKRACHPLFFGAVVGNAVDVSGIQGAQTWSQSALFRYRSRRDVMEIATNPAFQERHEYKMAALLKTIAVPVEPSLMIDMRLFILLLLFSVFSALDWLLFRK